MNPAHTLLCFRQSGGWWVGWIPEVPGVNAQERTKSKLLASLKIVLAEALEFEAAEGTPPEGGGHA